MGLATHRRAPILSAVIFNALIIVALIPLALRGVAYRPVGAGALLRRNLLIYGLGGLIVPFIGIKLIDLVLVGLHLHVSSSCRPPASRAHFATAPRAPSFAGLVAASAQMLMALLIITGASTRSQ